MTNQELETKLLAISTELHSLADMRDPKRQYKDQVAVLIGNAADTVKRATYHLPHVAKRNETAIN